MENQHIIQPFHIFFDLNYMNEENYVCTYCYKNFYWTDTIFDIDKIIAGNCYNTD